jgi:hypothetical protein
MSYIGSQPADSYLALSKQDFTTSATTTYTLSNSVTSSSDIALFINFVRQEPETAYSASGTTLTLTEATSASDDMYCVYLGRTVGTINPPNGSVGTAQLDNSLDFSSKTITLASNMTNTPAFLVYKTSNQDIAEGTETKVTWSSEAIDTDNAFASDKFTVPSGKAGKYFFSGSIQTSSVGQSEYQYGFLIFYKNGSRVSQLFFDCRNNNLRTIPITFSYLIDLAVSDYIEVYISLGTSGADQRIIGADTYVSTWFSGHKLIT